jgi:ketosteroid isomerase-like protein
MHKIIVLAVAVLALAGVPAFAQGPAAPVIDLRSPAAGEAVAVVDAFHAALQENDVTGALFALADDVVIFEGGRVERSKVEYASHHAPADAAYSAAVPSTLLRRTAFAEGAAAWIVSEARAKGSYKEKAVDQLTTETMLLRKDPAGWRIIHIHWSSRPAPKS